MSVHSYNSENNKTERESKIDIQSSNQLLEKGAGNFKLKLKRMFKKLVKIFSLSCILLKYN